MLFPLNTGGFISFPSNALRPAFQIHSVYQLWRESGLCAGSCRRRGPGGRSRVLALLRSPARSRPLLVVSIFTAAYCLRCDRVCQALNLVPGSSQETLNGGGASDSDFDNTVIMKTYPRCVCLFPPVRSRRRSLRSVFCETPGTGGSKEAACVELVLDSRFTRRKSESFITLGWNPASLTIREIIGNVGSS